MAYTMWKANDKRDALSSYFKHGHTGFAWAARRSVLDKHGLYDCQILGNGDFVMGHAMYGSEDFWNGQNWECNSVWMRMGQLILHERLRTRFDESTMRWTRRARKSKTLWCGILAD